VKGNFQKSIYSLYAFSKRCYVYEKKSVLEGIFVRVVEIIFEQQAFATPTLNISSASLILLPKKSQDVNVLYVF
jgi:hypothetical protein